MAGSNNHIRGILKKYIAGEHTAEEFKQLLTYLHQEDTEAFEEEPGGVWEKLKQESHRPGEEEALTLGLKALKITRQVSTEKKTAPVNSPVRFILRFAAAVVLLLVVATSGYLVFTAKKEFSDNTITLIAERGQKKILNLTDGSLINLNSESSLVYPEHFHGKSREVTLSGEAYFEIAHDSLHPFVVNTSEVKILVLGTSFNIRNYASDVHMTITVSTGKVKVLAGDAMHILLPDEQLYINKNTGNIEMHHVFAEKYSQWRKGMLFFDHTPLSEVAETLERWYNTDICVGSNASVLISGNHDNKNLQAVLEAICFTTGLKFRNTGDCITLY